MTVSPKIKKILMWGGGAAGVVWLTLAMAKCSRNGSERDVALDSLATQTVRVDSLQNTLATVLAERDDLADLAQARKDRIQALLEDTSCADSIVVLNDSIGVLNDSIAGLNKKLTDCKKRRSSARRSSGARRQIKAKPVCDKGNVTVVSGAGQQVTVPSNTSGTVIVNNGNNNTVNVNNGTINNTCAPENKKPQVKCVSASATVERTYVITYQRKKCR